MVRTTPFLKFHFRNISLLGIYCPWILFFSIILCFYVCKFLWHLILPWKAFGNPLKLCLLKIKFMFESSLSISKVSAWSLKSHYFCVWNRKLTIIIWLNRLCFSASVKFCKIYALVWDFFTIKIRFLVEELIDCRKNNIKHFCTTFCNA